MSDRPWTDRCLTSVEVLWTLSETTHCPHFSFSFLRSFHSMFLLILVHRSLLILLRFACLSSLLRHTMRHIECLTSFECAISKTHKYQTRHVGSIFFDQILDHIFCLSLLVWPFNIIITRIYNLPLWSSAVYESNVRILSKLRFQTTSAFTGFFELDQFSLLMRTHYN